MTGKVNTGPVVRSLVDEWAMTEYGDRLFSMGGSLFGSHRAFLRLAVATACIDVLAQDVSKTPCYLRRRTPSGSDIVVAEEHKAAGLLNSGPNEFFSIAEFFKYAVSNLACDSEYFIVARRTTGGELIEFAGIPRENISGVRVFPETRKVFCKISPGTQMDRAVFGWAKGLRSFENVAHIKRRSFNGIDILSTAKISKDALKLLSSMQAEQISHYGGGGLPKLAFTFPDALNDEQFDRLRSGLDHAVRASISHGKPIVLEGAGGTVPGIEKLSMTVTDEDFVKNSLAAAMNVIRYFRVPPHKVFLMERSYD